MDGAKIRAWMVLKLGHPTLSFIINHSNCCLNELSINAIPFSS